VLEDLGVIALIRRGWEVVRKRLGDVMIMAGVRRRPGLTF
jgi:hypothetical protein